MSTSPSKKSGWAIVFLAIFFFSPLKAVASKEPIIRVLIGSEYKVNFRGDGSQSFFVKGISSRKKRINSLKLIKNNGEVKYSINNRNDEWLKLPRNFNLIIINNDKRGIWFKNRRYAGELRVLLNNDKIIVINYLKLEKYLKSVVGSEMPKEFPLAALQAQAIAARTYVLKVLGKNNLFDIHSTQTSQVYLGLEAETPKVNRAVRSTNSLALFYDNQLIDAVFHSSSGGRTEDSGKVWRYQLPYLKSVIDFDQNSTKYRWSNQFSSKDLINLFPGLGGVNSIRIIDRSDSNRVLKVLVNGPNGKKILSGKELRNKLQLLSTKFEPYLKFSQINQERNTSKMTYSNRKTNLSLDNDYILKPLPMIPDDYFLVLQGFGAGHGVGMSQWGAKGMAERGSGFRKILQHYYSGVQIKTY